MGKKYSQNVKCSQPYAPINVNPVEVGGGGVSAGKGGFDA